MDGQYYKEKLKAQIQMQSKEQLQNQKYGNFTMATVLSTAENLAWRLCQEDSECIEFFKAEYKNIKGYIPGRMIFNSYNSYNSGNIKSINSLINQFIFQIENFEEDYKEFEGKYSEYPFPNNLSKDEIIIILNIWIDAINHNLETKNFAKYFINLRNIFQRLPIISYENEVREKFKNNPKSGKANPKVIQKEYANAVNHVHHRTKDIENQNIDLFKK